MTTNNEYFQKLGFTDEAAWEKERQDRCDVALKEIESALNTAKTGDADTRRAVFCLVYAKFKEWTNWIQDSQQVKV